MRVIQLARTTRERLSLSLLLLLATIALHSNSILAQSEVSAEPEIVAGINTPIMRLLERDDAREIVERYLPRLVQALDERFEVQEFLGSSSLLELSIDDDHVIGFDEEMLAALKAELDALSN